MQSTGVLSIRQSVPGYGQHPLNTCSSFTFDSICEGRPSLRHLTFHLLPYKSRIRVKNSSIACNATIFEPIYLGMMRKGDFVYI